MMNIRMFESPNDKSYRFEILHGKKVLLSQKGISDKETCIKNIQRTLRTIYVNDIINVSSVGGGGYVFSAGKAESRKFKSIEEASDAIAILKEEGSKSKGKFEVHIEGKMPQVISKRKLGTVGEGYDFKQVSKTQKPGFELIDKEADRVFYFHLNDEDGKPMMHSRSYDGKRQRIKAANALITAIKDKKASIKIVPYKGKFMFVVKDGDGFEVARSRVFRNKATAEEAITYLKKSAKGKVKIFKLPKKKKKSLKLPKEKFLLKQVAPKGHVGFESFKSPKNKCHYYHYHDANGRVLLYSRAFDSRKKRTENIKEIIALSQVKERYIMKEKKDQHYFTITTEKGKTIARSRYFDTKRNMIIGMKHFLTHAPSFLNSTNTVLTNQVEKIPIDLSKLPKENIVEKEVPPTSSTPTVKKIEPREKKDIQTNTPTPSRKKEPIKKASPTGSPTQRRGNHQAQRTEKTPAASTPKQNTPAPKKTTRPPKTIEKQHLKEVAPVHRATTKVKQVKPILPKRKGVALNEGHETSSFKWWILPLLALPLLLIYFFAGEDKSAAIAEQKTPVSIEEPNKNIKPVREITPVKKVPTLLGPNGPELGLSAGSTASKIADFLSLPSSVFPKTFLLDRVHFNSNKDNLLDDAFGQLDRIVQILKAYPTAQVQINGHTDNSGNQQRNRQLSIDRANRVKSYLVGKGIEGQRMSTKGFGANQPAATNQTSTGQYNNRRSEIVLLRR